MNYEEKAFEIIKNSIKSAIFIDEKALEFYSEENLNENIIEHTLSVKLHKAFKQEGISLAVHKFEKENLTNEKLKRYLFKDRDLVLLDWELDADNDIGIKYSLKLLSEIVNANHINFCCIYSSSAKFHQIFNHLLSYFSGISKEEREKIKSVFDGIEELVKIGESFKYDDLNEYNNVLNEFNEIGLEIELINQHFQKENINDSIRKLLLTFSRFEKSDSLEYEPNIISYEKNSLVINNTIIFILEKKVNDDINTDELLKRIRDVFITTENNFVQLLGLEMQTVFNNEGSFIDENLLNVSKETIFAHRNHLKEVNKSDLPFKALIKNVLIEHSTLKLRTANLSILEESFLDNESKKQSNKPSKNDVASLNTFYNSVQINNLKTRDFQNVNFGDIFYDGTKYYYLCITALCDCLRPEKIKQNYYFVKGEPIDIELANTLGDTAFISYLSDKICVSWVTLESTKVKKPDNTGLSNELKQINNLKAENEALKQFKFKPAYIEPHNFNAKNSTIIDNKIQVRRVESTKEILEDNGTINFIEFHYVSTLRPNYTQRIANHAFTHPVRVGVDFVKI
ncbi:response regulator receiver domain [Flavobacterium oreochromis]|uniref:Response receiver domain-containing protein n=1 Tax=Flavobacterium columnare TaxID=996 RepID=A0A246GAM1_9FLAO|nr:response regulator receiver domain [Flavobacterium oreochromis]OWP77093.1 hypothetical protein BWK62_08285 [Flavobacterium oreochromis]